VFINTFSSSSLPYSNRKRKRKRDGEREKEKRGMATFLVNTSINNSPLKRKRSNINNKKEEEE
jgi:hypothetical protein